MRLADGTISPVSFINDRQTAWDLRGSQAVCLAFLPYFEGVDDVLPEDITAGTDGGEGIKEGIGHPDGKSSVLLTKSLAGLDDSVEEMTDILAHSKLDDTEHQAQQGDGKEEPGGGLGMYDVLHRGARDDEQRGCPEIEGEVAHGDDP